MARILSLVPAAMLGLALSQGQAMAEDQSNFQRCLDVEIGAERTLDCINGQIKRQVDQQKPLPNIPPLDARSPDVQIGVFNQTAVKEQYGKNFGLSVVPYRPPAAVTPQRH